ncbi:MAG: cellulase family glycosylhydrolase [Spirochaetales bacterium]|nr:cellulase family glycosylhydrolase [Spirochaetales bacterium]
MKKLLVLMILIIMTIHVFAQTVKVQYMCGEPTVFFYKIRPFINIINEGTESVSLSGFSVRYYYTKEGYVAQKLTYDWNPVSGVSYAFKDGYLELNFSSGSLGPGEKTGGIQIRIEKEGGGYFDQADDYSFGPDILEFTDYEKVTMYRNGNLVWGIEPPPSPEPTPPPPAGDDWLHTQGSTIRDSQGNIARLTGINWFGFETEVNGFYNFDKVNWRFALETMTELGFNILRFPLSGELVNQWRGGSDPLVNHVNGEVNWDIDGVSSLTLLDLTIEYCKVLGMKIMFDMHGYAKSQNESVWYENNPVSDFQSAWKWLAARYKGDDTIVAVDLFNEPHGQAFGNNPAAAKWDGSSDNNNWRKAAEDVARVILAENPNLLIMVEGIECTPMEGYTYASTDKYTYNYNWWGGNLRGVADYPVNLGSGQDQLVYSPHDYGPDIHLQPWFQGGFDMQGLIDECWYPNWFYIAEQDTAPVLIGEWGGKLANADNRKWLELLAGFIVQENLHHTFWCFNPNSGDTGGIMLDDWNTVDETKYGIVKQTLWKNSSGKYIGLDHEIDLGKSGTGTNIGTYYGGSTPTPVPTPTPVVSETPTPVSTVEPTPGIERGDVNNDGSVDIVDALLTAQYYVGLDPEGFNPSPADVNCDDSIDIVDALLIAQYYVGLITEFC